MDDLFWIIIKFFIFPGIIFVIWFAFFAQWLDRKFYARAQQRIGPPFSQPYWDFVKLLAKKDTPHMGATTEFQLLPAIILILSFIIVGMIPIYGLAFVDISFPGDLIFILFLFTLHGGLIFLLGWSSRSPYSITGGARAILSEMSVELPFVLCLITPAIITGSFQITSISKNLWPKIAENPLYLLGIIPAFFILIFISTAIIERPPFDPGHAETEIVHGWKTELKGKSYAMVSLSSDILTWAIAGLIATIFLKPFEFWFPGYSIMVLGKTLDILGILANFIIFFITTSLVLVIFSLIRTTQARLRIDQIVYYFWKIFLPITLGTLGIVIIIGGI